MTDYLDNLAGEGQFHSRGEFSLDLGQVFRKVRERLLQPEDTLLYLVQSAVASGATYWTLNVRNSQAHITHNGYFPPPEKVQELPRWSILSSKNVVEHRLGMAVAASLALPGQGMTFEYRDGQVWQWSPGEKDPCLTGRTTQQPVEHPTICIPLLQPWWRRFLRLTSSPLLDRVRQRTRFATLDLTVCGKDVAGQEFGKLPHGRSWSSWSDNTVQLEGEDGPIYNSDHHTLEWRRASSGSNRLNLPIVSLSSHSFGAVGEYQKVDCAVAMRLQRRPSRIEVVQFGVSLTPVTTDRIPPESWVLFADNELPTDPTCLRPIQTEELLARAHSSVETLQLYTKAICERAKTHKKGLIVGLVSAGRFPTPVESYIAERKQR